MRLHNKLEKSKLPSHIISSRSMLRILEELVLTGPQTKTSLLRKLNSRYPTIAKNLEVLKREKIISEIRSGKICIYVLNENEKKAMILKNFITEWVEHI